jgi:hypothetical protein
MVNRTQAIKIIQELIEKEVNPERTDDQLKIGIIEEWILEGKHAYMIPTQSVDYIETGNESHMLLGGQPYIVSKADGSILARLPGNKVYELAFAEFEAEFDSK